MNCTTVCIEREVIFFLQIQQSMRGPSKHTLNFRRKMDLALVYGQLWAIVEQYVVQNDNACR